MISQKEEELGKLFVGGLSWETTQENLQRYFSRYGEVIDCVVMKNNESGRSRGFGFVTFADPDNVGRALENCPHNLDGRTIDPKPCNPRSLHKPKRTGGYPKVFLGGLPANVTETDLRNFFNRYGMVMEVVIMYDQEKKKSRGFGFLSFENDAAVDRATQDHFVNLNGKQVEIKKAEPRDGSSQNSSMAVDSYQWGGSTMPPMGNGQMGGPVMNMPPMGMPNMNQGYQQWNSSQSQGYGGYGSNTSNASFGGWPPQQWGANYGAPPQPQQSQGYGTYDSYGAYNSTTGNAGNYGSGNWSSWNVPNMPATGSAGSTGDMYSRPQSGPNAPPTGPTAPPSGPGANSISKPGSDYNGYSAYGGGGGNYNAYDQQQQQQQQQQQPQSFNNRPRSAYGTDGTQQYPTF
ncbi:unnamed protein product [Diamesa hyperborea]